MMWCRYFGEMPWAAIPFGDATRRRALAARCGVRGIPTLATIGADGVVINQKAKESALADGKVRMRVRVRVRYPTMSVSGSMFTACLLPS